MRKKPKKSQFSNQKHYFHFTLPNGKVTRVACKVRYGTKTVELPLTAEHVRKSIDAEGYGNTQTCVMAICVKDRADVFPHSVDGYVDWTYNRAYVVSKTDKNGWPCECVIYSHDDEVAKEFDKRKEDGVIDLWKKLEKEGPRTITLHPVKARKGEARKYPKERKNERKKVPHRKQPKGAALRFGIVSLGMEGK